MALADYYTCDICGKKTFYDAHCYAGYPENVCKETGYAEKLKFDSAEKQWAKCDQCKNEYQKQKENE